jgi:5-methylcytosine-specific restriction protein A
VTEAFDLIPHRRYRRREIHERWKGQRQGGISTPASMPAVFVFSGPTGKRFGYDQDEGWQPDGTFQYTGEGQRGPMVFERGNKAVRDHAEMGKDLYLFVESPPRRDRSVIYEGPMVCVGFEWSEAPDIDGAPRATIVFRLAPLETVATGSDAADAAAEVATSDLTALYRLALEQASEGGPAEIQLRKTYRRAAAIKRLARERANGRCEGCRELAPFVLPSGDPYLEVHHLTRLSDDGPDHPDHVVAVCPNCHRRAHLAIDAISFNDLLRNIRG